MRHEQLDGLGLATTCCEGMGLNHPSSRLAVAAAFSLKLPRNTTALSGLVAGDRIELPLFLGLEPGAMPLGDPAVCGRTPWLIRPGIRLLIGCWLRRGT
jgi:hypothetical protein